MGCVYHRKGMLYLRFKDENGQPRRLSTGLRVGQEEEAREILQKVQAQLDASRNEREAMLSLREYAEQWVEDRRQRGLLCYKDDESRLRHHVFPVLGDTALEDVRPRDVRALVRDLRAAGTLAPRTVRHVYATLRTMYRDAEVDELVDSNPCILKKGELPGKTDKNPAWRAKAIFTRSEVERLLWDETNPTDRRTLYALMALAGLRFSEASALRWSDYEPGLQPLGRLLINKAYNTKFHREKSVKTERPRQVPVHPALARTLAEWKLSGWPQLFGRLPLPDDLIVPSRMGRHRQVNHALTKFHQDLERLDLRKRRQHDLRRTFISLLREDGARKDVVEWMSHGSRGDIIDQYTELPWKLLCEELGKLQISTTPGSRGEVVVLEAAGEGSGTPTATLSAEEAS